MKRMIHNYSDFKKFKINMNRKPSLDANPA